MHCSIYDTHYTTERLDEITKLIKDFVSSNRKKMNDEKVLVYFRERTRITEPERKCTKCSCGISAENGIFFCVVCQREGKKVTFCTKCVPDSDKDDFSLHDHHLYYIPPNSEFMIDKMNVDHTRTHCEKVDPNDNPYYEECYGKKLIPYCTCSNCFEGNIKLCCWTCAVCIYVLCNACFEISQDPKHPKYSELNSMDHDPTHIMARIPYLFVTKAAEMKEIK